MAPPGPSEAQAIEAYELHRDGMSWREVAAEMQSRGHRCGNHTTAGRWIAIGHALVTQDDENDGKVHPMRKRRARRDMAIDALDAIRVRMTTDSVAGDLDAVRVAAYRVEIAAIQLAAQIGGWRAAPEPARAKVKVSGSGSKPVVFPVLLDNALAGLPPEDFEPPRYDD